MSNSNTQTASAIGLDVGTSRIVAAYREDKGIQFDTQLNAFVTIPFSKLTQSVLKKERIPHMVQDSEITVYGDESERFANLFHKETRRPMLRGVLNPDENGQLDAGARDRAAGHRARAGRRAESCASAFRPRCLEPTKK